MKLLSVTICALLLMFFVASTVQAEPISRPTYRPPPLTFPHVKVSCTNGLGTTQATLPLQVYTTGITAKNIAKLFTVNDKVSGQFGYDYRVAATFGVGRRTESVDGKQLLTLCSASISSNVSTSSLIIKDFAAFGLEAYDLNNRCTSYVAEGTPLQVKAYTVVDGLTSRLDRCTITPYVK